MNTKTFILLCFIISSVYSVSFFEYFDDKGTQKRIAKIPLPKQNKTIFIDVTSGESSIVNNNNDLEFCKKKKLECHYDFQIVKGVTNPRTLERCIEKCMNKSGC